MDDVIVISCLWCTDPGFSSRRIKEFITRDHHDNGNPSWLSDAYEDLCSCSDCVDEYHQSLASLFTSRDEDTSHLRKRAYKCSVDRLSDQLRSILSNVPEVKTEEGECTYSKLKSSLETPLLELLGYPRLLLDRELCTLFISSLTQLEKTKQKMEVTGKKLPGVYLLLVHPDELVRRWAGDVVHGLGLVDWDDYDQLEEVVHWLFNVVLYDMFSDPHSNAGEAVWNEDSVIELPSHLYNPHSRKDFWVGLCMLVTAMDSSCIRYKLMTSNSGHPEIAENILDTLKGDPTVFRPVVKCLSLLLEQLGSRFWQFFKDAPKSMCQAIFTHSAFCDALAELASRDSHSEIEESFSQFVYRQFSRSRSRENDNESTDSVVFCWILPFVQSLLDFGSHMEDDVCSVFQSLSEILKNYQPGDGQTCSVLYEEVAIALLRVASYLYEKPSLSILYRFRKLWLNVLVKSVDSCQVTDVQNALLFKLLNTPVAKKLYNNDLFAKYVRTRSRQALKNEMIKSLASHVSLVLKSLSSSQKQDSHERSEGSSSLSRSLKSEPMGPLSNTTITHGRTSMPNFGIKQCSVPVKKEKTHPTTYNSCVNSKLKFPPIKSRSKQQITNSTSSTDELEDWECGPARPTSTNTASTPKKKKKLSLKNQKKNILFKEEKSKSPQSSLSGYEQTACSPGIEIKKEPLLRETDRVTPPLSPVLFSDSDIVDVVGSPIISPPMKKKMKLSLNSEFEQSIKSETIGEPSTLIFKNKKANLSREVVTSPLSDSSSDNELPSLHTLMTTPTREQKKTPIRTKIEKRLMKDRDAKEYLEQKASKDGLKDDPGGTIVQPVCAFSRKTLKQPVKRRNSVNNYDFTLSQQEVEEFDKFSEDDDSTVVGEDLSQITTNLSADDIKAFNDFSDDEKQANNFVACDLDLSIEEIKNLNDFGTDKDKQLEDEPKLKAKMILEDPPTHKKTKPLFSVENDLAPPDSQSESTFVCVDLRDRKESCPMEDTEDEYETVFHALEVENKLKTTRNFSSDAFKPFSDSGDLCESENAKLTVSETHTAYMSEVNFSDEDIQTIYNKRKQARGRSEDTCSEVSSKSIEQAPGIPASNSPTLKPFSVDIVRLNITDLSPKQTSINREVARIEGPPVKETSTMSVSNVGKGTNMSASAVEATITENDAPTDVRESTQISRKRKKISPEISHASNLASSTHNYPSKRVKTNSVKSSANNFLSARRHKQSKVSAPPAIVEPPGIVYSKRKAILQKAILQKKNGTPPSVLTLKEIKAIVMPSQNKNMPDKLKPRTEKGTHMERHSHSSHFHRLRALSLQSDSSPCVRSVLSKRSMSTDDPVQSSSRPKPSTTDARLSSREAAPVSKLYPTVEISRDNAEYDSDATHMPSLSKPTPFSALSALAISKQHPISTTLKQPAFRNELSKSTQNLMSSVSASTSNPSTAIKRHNQPSSSSVSAPHQHSSLQSQPAPSCTPQPTITTKPTRLKTMDDLFTRLLCWDPGKFLYPEQDERGRRICPPCDEDLIRGAQTVPLTFLSYDEYFGTFAPLFFIELWETVFNEMTPDPMSSCKPPPFVATIDSFAPMGPYKIVRTKAIIPSSKAREYAHPNERDLVVVVPKKQDSEQCFALVDSHKHNYQGDKCEVFLTLKVYSRVALSERVQLKVVLSLTNMIRQWMGLINFHTNVLIRDILHPRGREYFCHPSPSQPTIRIGGSYNTSQRESIAAGARAMCEQYALPRILLLQGPPGTGKTHTISGLIQEGFSLLLERSVSCRPSSLPGARVGECRRPHLLVCAPSNAAVDEIIRKMLKEGVVAGSTPPTGHSKMPRQLNVVRIGSKDKMHPHIVPFSLDEIAKKKLKSRCEGAPTDRTSDEIKQQISHLDVGIETAEKERYVLSRIQSHRNSTKLKDLKDCIEKLNKEKYDLLTQYRKLRAQCENSRRDQSKVRKRILMEADVVCATLSGSGSYELLGCVQNLPRHFDCVIVDEASQCTELDILVPLRYRISKLVLVGDPLQLPPTVHSIEAERLGYGQSLFERLYKLFADVRDNPVKMLNVQYRMLPEICYFPSLHFYSNRLQTDSSVESSVNFNSFLVFDVQRGTEENIEGSFRNMAEAQCLLSLLRVLRANKVPPRCIGVITPYRAQERNIRNLIKRELNDMSGVDVGTVDGFQGREKDIIVLSCVRANSTSGTVGFLCNRKRLNVALTRAKRALYILGHLKTLKINKDWLSLIKHADECKAISIVCNPETSAKLILRSSNPHHLKYIKSPVIGADQPQTPTLTTTRSIAAQGPTKKLPDSRSIGQSSASVTSEGTSLISPIRQLPSVFTNYLQVLDTAVTAGNTSVKKPVSAPLLSNAGVHRPENPQTVQSHMHQEARGGLSTNAYQVLAPTASQAVPRKQDETIGLFRVNPRRPVDVNRLAGRIDQSRSGSRGSQNPAVSTSTIDRSKDPRRVKRDEGNISVPSARHPSATNPVPSVPVTNPHHMGWGTARVARPQAYDHSVDTQGKLERLKAKNVKDPRSSRRTSMSKSEPIRERLIKSTKFT